MALGLLAKKFHAEQQASTMSQVSKMLMAGLLARCVAAGVDDVAGVEDADGGLVGAQAGPDVFDR